MELMKTYLQILRENLKKLGNIANKMASTLQVFNNF